MSLEKFLKENEDIINNEDSEKFIKIIVDSIADGRLNYQQYLNLEQMFRDLEIFEDVAMDGADPKKKYKYVAGYAFGPTVRGTIDLRNTVIYHDGVPNPASSEVIIDDTTTIKSYGIWIAPNYKEQKFKLTFLGVPKVEECGIAMNPKTLSQVEIYAKADIVEDIKNLFDKGCIITNKSSLKNKIEVI